MNIFLAIFIFLFFILVLRRVLKKKDTEKLKLLCPFCDSIVAFIGLPSKTVFLLKNKEDRWLGSQWYAKIKLERDIYLICPNCLKLVIMEVKKFE